MCAKLVFNRRKNDSSKQALYDLHLLPIKASIEFKILTYMFNCSVGKVPVYLTELLSIQISKCNLRSSVSSVGCYNVAFNKTKIFQIDASVL